MTWTPGHRAAQRALEEPYPDVPAHLAGPLWSWTSELLDESVEQAQALVIAMRWDINVEWYYYGGIEKRLSETTTDALQRRVRREPTLLLDVAEWFLESGLPDSTSLELDRLLEAANSAYGVRADGRGLEFRVLPEVRRQVQATVDEAAGSPGAHLATAWNEAYGRIPDPVKAYSEAIKAVEAAAVPVVSPSNGKATLGTIVRDVGAKPSKWTFAIGAEGDAGVEQVRTMMQTLWNGQTSRHGGLRPTQPETVEAARAAVMLAATLVQFCVGGQFAVASAS